MLNGRDYGRDIHQKVIKLFDIIFEGSECSLLMRGFIYFDNHFIFDIILI
jgi:hypothetical protein